jgi:hypothetical protein
VPDNRFLSAGVDERFKTAGVDARFATVGVDAWWPTPTSDARFSDAPGGSTAKFTTDVHADTDVLNAGLTIKKARGTSSRAAARANTAITGKKVFEAKFDVVASSDGVMSIGVASASHVLTSWIGREAQSCGTAVDGSTSRDFNTNGTNFGAVTGGVGRTLMIAIDEPNRKYWVKSDGGANWNGSGTANPATGVGGIDISSLTGALYPAGATSGGVTTGDQLTFNFAGPFINSAPSGFTTL